MAVKTRLASERERENDVMEDGEANADLRKITVDRVDVEYLAQSSGVFAIVGDKKIQAVLRGTILERFFILPVFVQLFSGL